MEPVNRNHRPRLLALLTCLAIGFSVVCNAADESLEYQVKAAFLLNFTKFVEWPAAAFEAPDSPITICILGEDPFGSTLDQIVAGEIVENRKIAISRLRRAPAPKACQVLFVGRPEREAASLLTALEAGVLTVGEGEGFIRDGGMIAFVIENRRVRFSANQAAAESAGLKISSRLLNVAKSVKK
jgi:hypothetical protein